MKQVLLICSQILAAVLCILQPASAQERPSCKLRVTESCVENKLVHSYLTEVSYREGDYSYTGITPYHAKRTISPGRKDIPAPVVLEWQADSSQTHLLVADSKGFSKEYRLDSLASRLEVCNLIPGRRYEALLLSRRDSTGKADTARAAKSDTLAIARIVPTGQVRMINTPSIRNVRDLGGWKSELFRRSDGKPKTIRYGRLFRGAEMDRANDITDEDRDILLNDLKIGADLDLRGEKESKRVMESPLGPHIDYYRIPSSAYTSSARTNTQARNFRWILNRLREGKNVFFHCAHGADRTGTLGFIIEAVLGVAEGDIDKDYELTTFYGWRSRKVDDKYDYGNMVISYYEVFNGQNITECVEEYLKSYGITQSEIDEFRKIMLE